MKRVGFFVTGTLNSHFFVTGQIGMKFWQKRPLLSAVEPSLKNSKNLPLRGWFCTKPPFLGCYVGSPCHRPTGQGLRFSSYRSLLSIREEGPAANNFLRDLPFRL